jgi:hypothetical protein
VRKTPIVNIYTFLYGLCLWLSVYFIEHTSDHRFTMFGEEYPIGLIFLAIVSTFRDLAQLSNLRFKSILALVSVCVFVLIDLNNSRLALSIVAALFWTELVDFAVFTGIVSRWNYSVRAKIAAVVTSDVIAIPMDTTASFPRDSDQGKFSN